MSKKEILLTSEGFLELEEELKMQELKEIYLKMPIMTQLEMNKQK